MPLKKELENAVNTEELIDDEELETFDDEDYGFIISPDGSLKSIMIPEDIWDDPPKEIKKILKIFGINNIHDIEPRTLH